MLGRSQVDVGEATKQGIAYMEKRYGVEFTSVGVRGGGVDSTNMSHPVLLLASPYVTDPGNPITVRAEPTDGGFAFSSDDFLYYKFAQDAKGEALRVVAGELSQSLVRTSISRFGDSSYPDSFDAQTTADEFFSFLRAHAVGTDFETGKRSLTTIDVLVVDQGQDLDAIAGKLAPALRPATDWGRSGRFNVPCSLWVSAYSAEQYQELADYLSKPRGADNPQPMTRAVREAILDF